MLFFPWPGDPPASPEGEADGGQATARDDGQGKEPPPSAKAL